MMFNQSGIQIADVPHKLIKSWVLESLGGLQTVFILKFQQMFPVLFITQVIVFLYFFKPIVKVEKNWRCLQVQDKILMSLSSNIVKRLIQLTN